MHLFGLTIRQRYGPLPSTERARIIPTRCTETLFLCSEKKDDEKSKKNMLFGGYDELLLGNLVTIFRWAGSGSTRVGGGFETTIKWWRGQTGKPFNWVVGPANGWTTNLD